MKKEIDPRFIIAVIAAVVIAMGIYGWRMFAPSASGGNMTPQQAGLGKPVYPAGQGPAPSSAPTGR